MAKTFDRRCFLRNSGMLAVSVGGALQQISALAPKSNKASHAKTPRLLTGLCAFSFGPLFKSGEMNFESFFEEAVALEADAVDMTGYYLESTEPAYLDHLRTLAFRNGMPFTGVACAATLLPQGQENKAETLGNLKKWVDVTAQLAAPQLRIFTGKISSGTSPSQAMDEVVETMKRAADSAAQKGVILAIENQRGVAETAEACLEIMHRVNSPSVGITLDITHFVPTPAQDNYAQIAACVPFATQTHIRSGKFDDGSPIDLDRIWRIFAEKSYRGYMSVEYESQTRTALQIRKEVPELMEKSRQLCRAYSAV